MEKKLKDQARTAYIEKIYKIFAAEEDAGMITSGSFNFPIELNGEEGWIEVVVKVTNDEGDDGYMKRTQYQDSIRNREERKAKAAKKAADAQAKREAAKAAKLKN